MLLVKNELDALGDSRKALKNILLEKINPKKMTTQPSLRILVEKYQYTNPGQNTIRVYFRY